MKTIAKALLFLMKRHDVSEQDVFEHGAIVYDLKKIVDSPDEEESGDPAVESTVKAGNGKGKGNR